MIINTKFKIGEEVYIIYKEKNNVIINKDIIKEIAINEKEDIFYYTNNYCDEIKECELVETYATSKLVSKIEELLKEKDNETK